MKTPKKHIDQQVVLGTHRGKTMPNLRRGEVLCPTCHSPGYPMLPDNKPGKKFHHPGREVNCRFIPLLDGER